MMRIEVKSLVKKTFVRKTSEQKKEEIKAVSEKALSKIEKYSTSQKDLLEYADFLARFHNYSSNNTALIHEQFSGSVAVASFKDWSNKGYRINKNEKGIQILSYTPITYFNNSDGETKQLSQANKKEKEEIKTGSISTWKVNGFKIGHVYDVSQTNARPEDLPKIFPNKQFNFTITQGNNAEYLKLGIQSIADEIGIDIRDMKNSSFGINELGSAKGAFVQSSNTDNKEIILNSRNTETQAIATSIHELAHAKLHHNNGHENNFDRATQEFQAELTSYIVCKHYGIDTSEKAIPYIANWTNNGEKVENKNKAIEEVHKTSGEFIDLIDTTISLEQEKDLQVDSELNNITGSGLYPINPSQIQYCDFTGKPFENNESYYRVEGMKLSEEAHSVLYSTSEWSELHEEDPEENCWIEEIYDFPEEELTDIQPDHNGDRAIYYIYNPNDHTKPEKLGTISDIVINAYNQTEYDRFVISKEFIEDLGINKDDNKETFNNNMKKYNILKNPNLKDFQQVNERYGEDKNTNLDTVIEKQNTQKKMAAMQKTFQR